MHECIFSMHASYMRIHATYLFICKCSCSYPDTPLQMPLHLRLKSILSVDFCVNTHSLIEVRPYTCPYICIYERERERLRARFIRLRDLTVRLSTCALQCVLQCGAVCCSVLQCVAVCCSVLQQKPNCHVCIYMWSAREIYGSVHLSIYVCLHSYEVRARSVCLYVYLSIFLCLSVCLSVCVSVCLSVCLSV